MRCYFSIDDGEWLKGQVRSVQGGTEVHFDADDKSKLAKTLILRKPEILFATEMTITGLHQIEWNKFEYVTATVKWTPTRKKNA